MAKIGNPSPYRVKCVYPVFTPPLNTLWRRDLNKNIPDSIENGDGVNVLREFQGGEEIIFLEFPLYYPYLQLLTKLLRLRKQLNSAPYGRFRFYPTSLQLSVQLHGQLLLADSARSKRFEDRFKGSHVKLWMNYRFHLLFQVYIFRSFWTNRCVSKFAVTCPESFYHI